MNNQKHLLTNEDYKNRKLHPVDIEFLNAMRLDQEQDKAIFAIDENIGRIIKIETTEQLYAFADKSQTAYDVFSVVIKTIMNRDRADMIYSLRVKNRNSWRLLAHTSWMLWEKNRVWMPSYHQTAGIVLCEQAAKLLNTKID